MWFVDVSGGAGRLWVGAIMFVVLGSSSCSKQQQVGQTNRLVTPVERPTNIRVRVTGDEFEWYVLYPGADGLLDTPDDFGSMQHLHLPIDTQVTLETRSKDYIYTIALPEYQLNEIAIPDLEFSAQFKTQAAGTSFLLGGQMCGYAHPNLIGTLFVESDADFAAWCEAAAATQPPAQARASIRG